MMRLRYLTVGNSFKVGYILFLVWCAYCFANVFPDYDNYSTYLLDFEKLSFRFVSEPGYVLITYCILFISDLYSLESANVTYAFAAFLVSTVILFGHSKNRAEYRVSLFGILGFILSPLLLFLIIRTPREAMALFFIFLAFHTSFSARRIKLLSLFYFVVAISIHVSSSTLFLVLYTVYYLKKDQKRYLLFLSMLIFTYMYLFDIWTQFVGLVNNNLQNAQYEVSSGRVRIFMLIFILCCTFYFGNKIYNYKIFRAYMLSIIVFYFVGFTTLSRIAIDLVLLSKLFFPNKYLVISK